MEIENNDIQESESDQPINEANDTASDNASKHIEQFDEQPEPSLRAEGGKLFVVSTPIGNPDDITRRAVKVLGICDLVVCEERKEGAGLLHRLGLKKNIDLLNEQNEIEKAPEILSLLQAGKKIGLISDGGTPLLADPGNELMRLALLNNIDIEVVPGVTSIIPALVRSGFSLDRFLFAGFLPRDRSDRERKIAELAKEKHTVAMLETPYRLRPVLDAFAKIMPDRKAYIGMNITLHFETHYYGTFSELWDKFKESKAKGEFVIVFQGDTGGKPDSGVGERIERAYKQRSGNLADQYRHLEGGVNTSEEDGKKKISLNLGGRQGRPARDNDRRGSGGSGRDSRGGRGGRDDRGRDDRSRGRGGRGDDRGGRKGLGRGGNSNSRGR
jgi:16S rRNA (cytidine1402-2'-O)-methyltransferase